MGISGLAFVFVLEERYGYLWLGVRFCFARDIWVSLAWRLFSFCNRDMGISGLVFFPILWVGKVVKNLER